MPLSAQQLAAQKNLSYVLAEKLAQRILKGEYEPGTILQKGWFYRDRELVPGSCHKQTGIFLIRNCLPGG